MDWLTETGLTDNSDSGRRMAADAESGAGGEAGREDPDARRERVIQAGLRCRSARPSRRTSAAAFQGDPPGEDDPLLAFAPFQHKVPRRNSITARRQREFIVVLAETGVVTVAARRIGASLEALYRLRNRPGAEAFAAAWEMALDRGIERLEDCAMERAILGEERPVVRGGKVVATWRRYDTALILFLLRQRRPDRWHESRHLTMRDWTERRKFLINQWEQEAEVDGEAALDSLNAKLEAMMEASGWRGEDDENAGD